MARNETEEIDGIKAIIREVWMLPADLLSEELTAFARELRNRIRRGDMKEVLYVRATLVQMHDMHMPLTPAYRTSARTLIDRVYDFLTEKHGAEPAIDRKIIMSTCIRRDSR
jgi:hypothetical protein